MLKRGFEFSFLERELEKVWLDRLFDKSYILRRLVWEIFVGWNDVREVEKWLFNESILYYVLGI